MSKIIRNLRKIKADDILCLIMFFIALLPGVILKKYKKNIWLIAERPDTAGDNGLEFYRWIRKTHSEDEAYFVLDKKAWNFNPKDSHMIAWRSFRHYVYYVASDVHVNVMFQSDKMNVRVCSYFNKLFKKNLRVAYIRHGIHKDGVEMHKYSVLGVRLFICGAKPEYDYFKANAGYPDENLVYTGLARFDDLLLNKRDDKYVLVIPTWRRYLIDDNLSIQENEQRFLESEYYQRYLSLFRNKQLENFLGERGYRIRFCIHAEFRRFLHLFDNVKEYVDFVSDGETIHELLLSTSLLITDYSSVFFDAAYADKPMAFYQFDYEEFRGSHFSEGYFSYERDAMGPVVRTESELVDVIEKMYSGNRFEMGEKYKRRSERFFVYHDTNNCQRIYDAIKKI